MSAVHENQHAKPLYSSINQRATYFFRGVVIAMALYGDNYEAAVADYINQRRQIWASKVPAAVKVIALAIIEHMQVGNLSAQPSKARLMRMCNMPESTFERYYASAKDLFEYQDRTGRTTVFSGKILNCAKELALLWPVKPTPNVRGGIDRTHPQIDRGSIRTPPHIDPPSENPEPPPNMGVLRDEERDTHTRARTKGDFVDVNCTAINVQVEGRRMSYDYQAISLWASMGLCAEDTARQIVEAEARGWVADGKVPDQPSRWLQSQISKWRTRKAIAETQIDNERKRGAAMRKTKQASEDAWLDREIAQAKRDGLIA
jgi:hypothetical protein